MCAPRDSKSQELVDVPLRSAAYACSCALTNFAPPARSSLGRLRLGGQSSWGQLAQDALAEWLPQLVSQWHRFVTSLTPLASVVNITSAASQLLMAPIRHAPLRGLSLRKPGRRQRAARRRPLVLGGNEVAGSRGRSIRRSAPPLRYASLRVDLASGPTRGLPS